QDITVVYSEASPQRGHKAYEYRALNCKAIFVTQLQGRKARDIYAGRGEGGPEVLTLVPRSYTRESGSVAQQIDHLRSEDGAQERFLHLGLANIQAVWVLPTDQFERIREGFPEQIENARDFEELFLCSRSTTGEREW
ncbi:hypothetical protein COZ14_01740, partial [Candidatus Dojkabacteria bacterium CG_4_10_14_3_um_filter_Dojkabacteria_WS6_41_9]